MLVHTGQYGLNWVSGGGKVVVVVEWVGGVDKVGPGQHRDAQTKAKHR